MFGIKEFYECIEEFSKNFNDFNFICRLQNTLYNLTNLRDYVYVSRKCLRKRTGAVVGQKIRTYRLTLLYEQTK